MTETKDKKPIFSTWTIIFSLVGFIMIKGLFAFCWIGDLGQPDWDYRPIKDVPGQSPYAMYETLPHPQHVLGEKGE